MAVIPAVPPESETCCRPARPDANLIGHVGQASVERRTVDEKIRLKLVEGSTHGVQRGGFLLLEIIVAADERRIFEAVPLQAFFDLRADANGTRQRKRFLTSYFFAADTAEKLIPIARHEAISIGRL